MTKIAKKWQNGDRYLKAIKNHQDFRESELAAFLSSQEKDPDVTFIGSGITKLVYRIDGIKRPYTDKVHGECEKVVMKIMSNEFWKTSDMLTNIKNSGITFATHAAIIHQAIRQINRKTMIVHSDIPIEVSGQKDAEEFVYFFEPCYTSKVNGIEYRLLSNILNDRDHHDHAKKALRLVFDCLCEISVEGVKVSYYDVSRDNFFISLSEDKVIPFDPGTPSEMSPHAGQIASKWTKAEKGEAGPDHYRMLDLLTFCEISKDFFSDLGKISERFAMPRPEDLRDLPKLMAEIDSVLNLPIKIGYDGTQVVPDAPVESSSNDPKYDRRRGKKFVFWGVAAAAAIAFGITMLRKAAKNATEPSPISKFSEPRGFHEVHNTSNTSTPLNTPDETKFPANTEKKSKLVDPKILDRKRPDPNTTQGNNRAENPVSLPIDPGNGKRPPGTKQRPTPNPASMEPTPTERPNRHDSVSSRPTDNNAGCELTRRELDGKLVCK